MEALAELSVDRYRPMLRLLNDDDLRFLRVQPGFTPDMARSYARQRCKIFRGYLKCLETDFRLCLRRVEAADPGIAL